MKSAIFAVVLLTLGLLSLPVLAQQQDLQDVMNAANALSARESELLSKKDAAGIASLFTSDGLLVMLAPQFAFKPGRDAIQKHYQGIIDAGATSITLELKNMERKEAGPYQQQLRAMPEFRFDPPLTLKGNIVIRNLDDAVRFMIGYQEARRPELQTSNVPTLEIGHASTAIRHATFQTPRGFCVLNLHHYSI